MLVVGNLILLIYYTPTMQSMLYILRGKFTPLASGKKVVMLCLEHECQASTGERRKCLQYRINLNKENVLSGMLYL